MSGSTSYSSSTKTKSVITSFSERREKRLKKYAHENSVLEISWQGVTEKTKKIPLVMPDKESVRVDRDPTATSLLMGLTGGKSKDFVYKRVEIQLEETLPEFDEYGNRRLLTRAELKALSTSALKGRRQVPKPLAVPDIIAASVKDESEANWGKPIISSKNRYTSLDPRDLPLVQTTFVKE